MINWLVRHIDVIQDKIEAYKQTEVYKDKQYIKEVIKEILGILFKVICYIVGGLISFIALFICYVILWCLFRG